MADIHIQRHHGMSLVQARRAAQLWAEKAEKKFDLRCSYEEGDTADTLTFERSGVSGSLQVNGELFELQAKLGFMLSAVKGRIEGEIVKTLDALIAAQPAGSNPASGQA